MVILFWRPCAALSSLAMMHRKSIYHVHIRSTKLPLEPFSCRSLLSGVLLNTWSSYPLQNYPGFSLHFLIFHVPPGFLHNVDQPPLPGISF